MGTSQFSIPLCRIGGLDDLSKNSICVDVDSLLQSIVTTLGVSLFALDDCIAPDFWLEQSFRVANIEEKVSWSRYGNVETALVCEETKTALECGEFIGSDAIEDDDVLLAALKCIHRVYFYVLKLLTTWANPDTDRVFQLLNLGLIRRDYSNFADQCPKTLLASTQLAQQFN